DDSASEDHDVGRLLLLQLLDHGWKKSHVRARVQRQPDHLRVLLQGRVDDHLRGLPKPGVDDLVAGVAQSARDNLHATVVAIEADLAHDNSDGLDAGLGGGHQITARSVYRPKTSIRVFMISPSVPYARTASRM